MSGAAAYSFSDFTLHPVERRLLASGRPVDVGGRALDLLTVLVENAGALVTSDELLARVWPRLVVEENNLHVQVSALRRLLGKQAIQNVAGQGYRFMADVIVERLPETSATPRGDNLPHQLTRFIGRASDVSACDRLLDHHRLLTVVGIGGLGKTRVCLAVAERRLAGNADGVWFVDLAAVRDVQLVPQAIAAVLGVQEQGARPLLDAIASHVAARTMLLVLDNCEHLVDGCAQAARRLLAAGPALTILTSSREPLHLAGEITYTLPTLSVPDGRAAHAIAGSEAVQLFVDRAAAVRPGFVLNDRNAGAIADICTHLDGIPLAIELAAANVGGLPVEVIAERLGDRFRLLRMGDRTALPRQRTLQATIDWSYDLLDDAERALLHRLSVFAGGWTLDAAEAVGAFDAIARSDATTLHMSLVDKSLVVMDADCARYRLLETVRLYASERLHAAGEFAAVKSRHLAFYLDLAEAVWSEARSDDENWAIVNAERENLRAAHAWAVAADDGAVAELRLVTALVGWLCVNAFDLGTPIMQTAFARPGVQARDLVRCRALAAAGWLCYNRGDYEDGRRYQEEALAIARELGAAEEAVDTLVSLGMSCHALGDRVAARHCLEAGLAEARRSPRRLALWGALIGLAELDAVEGRLACAEELYDAALALGDSMNARHLRAVTLLNLARVGLSRESASDATSRLREALTVFDAMGGTRNLHALLGFAAGLSALLGDGPRAARFEGAAKSELARIGLGREPADVAALSPLLARARASLGDGRFDQHADAGIRLSAAEALHELRAWLDGLG